MTDKYADNATNAIAEPVVKSGIGDNEGRVRCLYDSYDLAGDLTTSDPILFGGKKLPKGARVVGYALKHDDLDASGGTLDLGWAASADLDSDGNAVEAADPNGFLSAVDVTSAGQSSEDDGFAQPGYLKKFSADVQIQAIASADTDATTGNIKVAIFYVLD